MILQKPVLATDVSFPRAGMKVISVYSIKGGVGKTSTAVNLAHIAAREGYRTLVWDLDPQGAASYYFRIKPKVKGGGGRLLTCQGALHKSIQATDFENLDLLPSDFSYRKFDLTLQHERSSYLCNRLGSLAEDYDLIFIDCAAGVSLVSENVFVASDILLIPVIPTVLSLRTLSRLVTYVKPRRKGGSQFLCFFCLVDVRKALHRQICRWGIEESPLFLRSTVPYSSMVEQMGVRRKPLGAYAPSSEPCRAYQRLWAEIRASNSESMARRKPVDALLRRVIRE